MASEPGPEADQHAHRSGTLRRVRSGVLVIVVIVVIEYLVVPQFTGASKNLDLLRRVNIAWIVGGVIASVLLAGDAVVAPSGATAGVASIPDRASDDRP